MFCKFLLISLSLDAIISCLLKYSNYLIGREEIMCNGGIYSYSYCYSIPKITKTKKNWRRCSSRLKLFFEIWTICTRKLLVNLYLCAWKTENCHFYTFCSISLSFSSNYHLVFFVLLFSDNFMHMKDYIVFPQMPVYLLKVLLMLCTCHMHWGILKLFCLNLWLCVPCKAWLCSSKVKVTLGAK